MNNPQANALYSILRSRILDGEYGKDGPLPTWRFLASEAGVSLPTVRQAFAQLESEGLVRWEGVGAHAAWPDGSRTEAVARSAEPPCERKSFGLVPEGSFGDRGAPSVESRDGPLPKALHGLLADVLRLVVDSLSIGVAFLSRIEGETLIIEGVDDRANMGLHRGDVIPLCDSYCTTMLENAASSLVVADAQRDPEFGPRITTRTLGIGAYAGIPLYRMDGTLYGTLCTLHPAARAVESSELSLLALAGRLIMQAVDAEESREDRLRARLEHARSTSDANPDLMMVVDYDGRIRSWTRNARAITVGEWRGSDQPSVFDMVEMQDRVRLSEHLHAVIDDQESRSGDYQVAGLGSGPQTARVSIGILEGSTSNEEKALCLVWTPVKERA